MLLSYVCFQILKARTLEDKSSSFAVNKCTNSVTKVTLIISPSWVTSLAFAAMASECVRDTMSLLYWSMLAAGTVGPGTVVVCARSGVEYQLHLAWTLIFASILAYTLQEGGARLTLVSGKTLGQCLQKKFGISSSLGAPRACWAFSFAVYIGNLLYQCNNFAGGIAALMLFLPFQGWGISTLMGYELWGASSMEPLYWQSSTWIRWMLLELAWVS